MKNLFDFCKWVVSFIGILIIAACGIISLFFTAKVVGIVTQKIDVLFEEKRKDEKYFTHKNHSIHTELENAKHQINKRLTVIETVLLMQGAPIKALTHSEEAPKSP
jgi:hypothetical protein